MIDPTLAGKPTSPTSQIGALVITVQDQNPTALLSKGSGQS
jgi:hypothetical protein